MNPNALQFLPSQVRQAPSEATASGGSGNQQRKKKPAKKEPPKQRNKKQAQNDNDKKPAAWKPKRKRTRKKKHDWKKELPEEALDPITLDPLTNLHYPPFALVTDDPIEIVPEWPVPETSEENRLKEQWKNVKEESRHYNLFDGRALAYYLVSELQFMDPLNRRELTRDEVVNLDNYLQRHNFKASVTAAYDKVQAGKEAINLQDEARELLNSLFSGTRGRAIAPTRGSTLRSQYQEHEDQTLRNRPLRNRSRAGTEASTGVLGGDGFMVVDDDLNPGLRSDATEHMTSEQLLETEYPQLAPPPVYVQYAADPRRQAGEAFPSLQSKVAEAPGSAPPRGPSKSLAKIACAVKQTDPEEQKRQFLARERAIRKAERSNIAFGGTYNPHLVVPSADSLLRPPTLQEDNDQFTESQLERNRRLIDAFQIRQTPKLGGWSRPVGQNLEEPATRYPDALIIQARERMNIILKVEKKWRAFLQDDKAASLPLNKMDRPTRSLVHEYSDYWRLHTESFDPEPNRYIHCVKMKDTKAPYPLLSEAVRTWRGPTVTSSDHPSTQTAGQKTSQKTREVLRDDTERQPLNLKPRSIDADSERQERPSALPLSGVETLRMNSEDVPINSRVEGLQSSERPKLELVPRTLPVERTKDELEAFQAAKQQKRRAERQEAKKQRDQEKAALEQRALAAAFDDEDDFVGGV